MGSVASVSTNQIRTAVELDDSFNANGDDFQAYLDTISAPSAADPSKSLIGQGKVAAGNNPNPLQPDVWAYGVATGAGIPQPFKGSVWILSPSGNPLQFGGSNGNIIFSAKPLVVGRLNPAAVFGHGLVGTYNTANRKWEAGYGGAATFNAAGVPITVWLNARTNIPPGFTGTVSANFGAAVAADQVAAKAFAGAGAVIALIPTPQTEAAAGALEGAAGVLTAAGQGANLFVGAGYRVELRFQNGQLEGIYYHKQKIVDLEQFSKNAVNSTRDRHHPPVIPNNGNAAIANYNYTNQMIFGTSPWSLAATSGGQNQGNGGVAVANDWRSAIQTYGQSTYSSLPDDIKTTVVFGPHNSTEAAAAVRAILQRVDVKTANKIVTKLQNPYDLDFGVTGVKIANDISRTLTVQTRPADYQFVRNVYEGAYLDPGDNPPEPFLQ